MHSQQYCQQYGKVWTRLESIYLVYKDHNNKTDVPTAGSTTQHSINQSDKLKHSINQSGMLKHAA